VFTEVEFWEKTNLKELEQYEKETQENAELTGEE